MNAAERHVAELVAAIRSDDAGGVIDQFASLTSANQY
jgi:hypothetical protein